MGFQGPDSLPLMLLKAPDHSLSCHHQICASSGFPKWSAKCVHLLFLMCPSLIVWYLIYSAFNNINISFRQDSQRGERMILSVTFDCAASLPACQLERQRSKSPIHVAWKAAVSAVQGAGAALASPNSSLESLRLIQISSALSCHPGSFGTPRNVLGMLPKDLISPFYFCTVCIQDSSPSQVVLWFEELLFALDKNTVGI